MKPRWPVLAFLVLAVGLGPLLYAAICARTWFLLWLVLAAALALFVVGRILIREVR